MQELYQYNCKLIYFLILGKHETAIYSFLYKPFVLDEANRISLG